MSGVGAGVVVTVGDAVGGLLAVAVGEVVADGPPVAVERVGAGLGLAEEPTSARTGTVAEPRLVGGLTGVVDAVE